VTGNSGSGKSTVGAQLAAALDLPLHGLDRIVWQPGWVKTPVAERRALMADLVAPEAWLIEGVDDQAREHADLLVLLDVPRHVCACRVLRRALPYLRRSRPGLPEDCPELRILPRLMKLIWRTFPTSTLPRILAAGERHPRFVHIRNGRELAALLGAARAMRGA
jgi:adenylate kinase family enzyme